MPTKAATVKKSLRRRKKNGTRITTRSIRANRKTRSTVSIDPATYRPHPPRGEVTFLLAIALLAMIFFIWPIDFFWKLLGSVLLLVIVPVVIIKEYWPGLALRQLGWQSPAHPRLPHVYSAVVTVLSFTPLGLYELVSEPSRYAAVNPGLGWIEWLTGQGLIAIAIMAQTAFFCGLLLFRLTHLMRPWAAIILIALITAVGNLIIPGPVKYLALPFTLALTWMSWQTKSFVPAAVTQILLTMFYDLLVRLTI